MDKILISGRIRSYHVDKLDMLAIKDDRARAYMVEEAIKAYVKEHEKSSGTIQVDIQKLESWRYRKLRKKAS